MNIIARYFFMPITLLLVAGNCCAESVPFDSDRWDISASESRVERHLGRDSLFLKCDSREKCFAVVRDSEFTDGIIEFDIAFDNADRGFMGLAWRMQDTKNFEEFYIRPHHSEQADANQYAPIINGIYGFTLYHEGYAASAKYSYNEWMPIKIVVSGKQAEVYVIDMDKPALFIPELKGSTQSGKVALKMDVGKAHFANFRYTRMSNPPLKGSATEEPTAVGTIRSWLVSDAFDEITVDDKWSISQQDKERFAWHELSSERSGLANLARVQGIGKARNCAFVRTNIYSDRTQVKELDFGFSERVKVYLNGQVIYGGNNTFRSRDHRFLGTIGFFDKLYLPLNKGDNELWIAVSQTLASGWAIQARLADNQPHAKEETFDVN